ncbi:Uncharacterized protein dnl_64310 [Desulfonema limicola]|uniref:Uncharacterized protein n=1 Tax=Desulfonema limicola TaxID=45656 RepID=A0A975GK00_9BACT|nr:hypothetical protein [Desulfonema limicola]QTA84000.1 Uncharacterized protein dnl_64310 [Desulfonema limicola]
MILLKKTKKKISTAYLASSIVCINDSDQYSEWFNYLLSSYFEEYQNAEFSSNMLSLELSFARILLLFIMVQNNYYAMYPNSKKLNDEFTNASESYFSNSFGDKYEDIMSLFSVRFLSYFSVFNYDSEKDRIIYLLKILNYHFSYCLHTVEPITYQVIHDSEAFEHSQPSGKQLEFCTNLIDNIAEISNTIFQIYDLVE